MIDASADFDEDLTSFSSHSSHFLLFGEENSNNYCSVISSKLDVPHIRSPNSDLPLVLRSRAGTDTAGPVDHLGRNYLSNDTYI